MQKTNAMQGGGGKGNSSGRRKTKTQAGSPGSQMNMRREQCLAANGNIEDQISTHLRPGQLAHGGDPWGWLDLRVEE